MSRYQNMFRSLARQGDGAFVPFVTLGDPNPEQNLEILRAMVRGGADALELGIPFSDPVADGPTIQAASVRALSFGVRVEDAWRIVATVRADHPGVPMGLLVYANLVFHAGPESFYRRAGEAGLDSVLVADVPTLEAEPFAAAALAHGVDPVLIATPNATSAALTRIAELSRGYTYVVTRSGVTGASDNVELAHGALLDRLAHLGAPPPLLGFGISRPEQVAAALASGAAGAISGSAIVDRIQATLDEPEQTVAEVERLVAAMKAATRGKLRLR